jgi:hypothetical protein
MRMYRDSDGVIKFKGKFKQVENNTESVEIDGKIFTHTNRQIVTRHTSDLSEREKVILEYDFHLFGTTEKIEDYNCHIFSFSNKMNHHSTNPYVNCIMNAFYSGLLDKRIKSMHNGKTNGGYDGYRYEKWNEVEVSLYDYGFNNSIYFYVDADMFVGMDRDKIHPRIEHLLNHLGFFERTFSYLIKDDNTGFYKIGKSKNPKNREKTLQSEKPTLKMVKLFTENVESTLHKKYNSQRVRGEWFKLTPIQVKYICTHY